MPSTACASEAAPPFAKLFVQAMGRKSGPYAKRHRLDGQLADSCLATRRHLAQYRACWAPQGLAIS
jgi:hypothetical protein